jgi:hypothetical protein
VTEHASSTLKRPDGFAILAVCIGLLIFGGNKLHRTAQVRGFARGPTPVSVRIATKWTRPARGGSRAYMVSWSSRQTAESKSNLSGDHWASVHVGDRLRIVSIDGESYVLGGIYGSDFNVVFDCLMLAAFFCGAVYGLSLVLPKTDRRRRAPAAPTGKGGPMNAKMRAVYELHLRQARHRMLAYGSCRCGVCMNCGSYAQAEQQIAHLTRLLGA